MAERLLQTPDVSDLCIAKPALRWLPPSATVADAVAELERGGPRGPDAALAVWDGSKEEGGVAGRVCMADVLLFLCADGNMASATAALQATLSDLLAAGAPPVRLIQHDASVLEAADAFLDGAHTLVVPIRDRRQAGGELCWLTLEDLVRFFLSSIALFAPTASRSVSDLGVVRPAALAVAAGDTALSAAPLLRTALASHTAVAIVSGESCPRGRQLVGDISPSTLCSSGANVAVAAAMAALSAGDLMAFLDWGGAPPDATLHGLRSRLRRRGLHGMLDLLYGGEPSCPSSSSCSSSASSSSSSDEDEDYGSKSGMLASPCAARRGTQQHGEAIVCHRGSSLVAVMVQAMAHRATQVWVVDEEDRELVGVVGLIDVLRVLRHHLHQPPLRSSNEQRRMN